MPSLSQYLINVVTGIPNTFDACFIESTVSFSIASSAFFIVSSVHFLGAPPLGDVLVRAPIACMPKDSGVRSASRASLIPSIADVDGERNGEQNKLQPLLFLIPQLLPLQLHTLRLLHQQLRFIFIRFYVRLQCADHRIVLYIHAHLASVVRGIENTLEASFRECTAPVLSASRALDIVLCVHVRGVPTLGDVLIPATLACSNKIGGGIPKNSNAAMRPICWLLSAWTASHNGSRGDGDGARDNGVLDLSDVDGDGARDKGVDLMGVPCKRRII